MKESDLFADWLRSRNEPLGCAGALVGFVGLALINLVSAGIIILILYLAELLLGRTPPG